MSIHGGQYKSAPMVWSGRIQKDQPLKDSPSKVASTCHENDPHSLAADTLERRHQVHL